MIVIRHTSEVGAWRGRLALRAWITAWLRPVCWIFGHGEPLLLVEGRVVGPWCARCGQHHKRWCRRPPPQIASPTGGPYRTGGTP